MTYAWVDLGNGRSVFRKVATGAPKRSHLASPNVKSDAIDLVSQIDGTHFTSDAKYRQHVKDHGCIIVGKDPALTRPRRRQPRPHDNRTIVRQAMAEHGL